MTMRIDFIFDFGSPNAYLAWKTLPVIAQRTGAEINLIPCLLGGIFKLTNNRAPNVAFGGVKGKLEYDALEIRRFVDRHGLSAFHRNPHFPVNTLFIMRGLIAARRAGVDGGYMAAVQSAMWEKGEKMDDPEVVRRVLEAAGLDAAGLIAATSDPEVKAELAANTEAAVARGVFGIPTFFVGNEMFFGKERLGQVEEAVWNAVARADPKTLEFYFDYRSPYSYLAHSQLDRLGAEVRFFPFDLRDLMKRVENVPTSVVCAPKNRYVREDLKRWAARYGVPFERHPQIEALDRRRLLRATLAAGQMGNMAAAVAAIFPALWAHAAPLQTPQEIAAVLARAGFDRAAIEARIDDPALDQALDAATEAAAARGVFGAPTFFVGDEMFFGNDRLDFIRDRLARTA